MKYIKWFSSDTDMNEAIQQIKHGDGAFLYYYNQSVKIIDQIHPGSNCSDVYKAYPVNMSPVKLDASSSKKKPAVADFLYSTLDGKLTLDSLTNGVSNTAIAICVIPEVMENFKNGDDSTGAVKTARFVSLNYMNCNTPTIGSKDYKVTGMYFGNSQVIVGNVKGGTDKTSYVGGKWNTQKCLDACTKENKDLTNGVTNNGSAGYCAPACCCTAYSTLGTKSGDWYLPSIGELYQIYANKTALKSSGLSMDMGYWSSIENSKNGVYYVNLGDGTIGNNGKYYKGYALAFLALEV